MTAEKVTPLREKMRSFFRIRNYSPSTGWVYLQQVFWFERYVGKSSLELELDDVRKYLLWLGGIMSHFQRDPVLSLRPATTNTWTFAHKSQGEAHDGP